ncbi:MAG: hypothetical protein IJ512_02740 [Ruminococcus sp.]|nr:hypothetical protein [Ruminococcus sp.]
MLKKILSPETCAQCRLCCQFDATDIWELPVLPPETLAAVQKLRPDTAFISSGDEHTFASPALSGEELFACPVLTECGCGLSSADKPFDCKIWPFRLMRHTDGSCVIAVSELCKGVAHLSDDALRQFLTEEGLADLCFAYARSHPAHIKPLMDGYRILL